MSENRDRVGGNQKCEEKLESNDLRKKVVSSTGPSLNNWNSKVAIPPRSDCTYHSCYCEENVWKLCDNIRNSAGDTDLSSCYVVFISNEDRVIPIWMQKSSKREDKLVLWDYHVILLLECDSRTLVYDLDTALSFPSEFADYASKSFRSEELMTPNYHRKFRVIPGKMFLSTFASDRSHMLKSDGQWIQEPPSYPCIQTAESTNNIQDFISMDPSIGVGEILSLPELVKRFQYIS